MSNDNCPGREKDIAGRDSSSTNGNSVSDRDTDPAITRRGLVAGAGAVIGLALAGCSGEQTARTSEISFSHAPPLPVRGDEKFFLARQLRVLEVVSDIMIPRTDTPGAVDAGVASYIDGMMITWASEETRKQFVAALRDFDDRAHDRHEQYFLESTWDQQYAVVDELDAETFGSGADNDNYRQLKSLIFHVYDTSEAANPDYRLVPGAYRGSLTEEQYRMMIENT